MITLNYLEKQVVLEVVKGNKTFKKQAIHIYNHFKRRYEILPDVEKCGQEIPDEIRYMEEVVSERPDFSLKSIYENNILRQTLVGL